MCRQTNAGCVVRQGEEQHNICKHGEESPSQDAEELGSLQQAPIEQSLRGANLLVAVLDKDSASEVDGKSNDSEDPEGPAEADALDNGVCG